MDEKTAREILKSSPIGNTGKICKAEGFLEGYDQGRRELINDPRIKNIVEYLIGSRMDILIEDFEQLKKEIENGVL